MTDYIAQLSELQRLRRAEIVARMAALDPGVFHEQRAVIRAAEAALAAALDRLAVGPDVGDAPATFAALHAANLARQEEWCPDQKPDLSFRGNELAGETGEACNEIKKLERERLGWKGSRTTKEKLASELADVVICADLVAIAAGIDLGSAVVTKFNETSTKVGMSVFLPLRPQPKES